jgi:hypothetical protein
MTTETIISTIEADLAIAAVNKAKAAVPALAPVLTTTVSSVIATIEADIAIAIAKAKAVVPSLTPVLTTVESRLAQLEATVTGKVVVVDTELAFVKANWGKCGIVVIAAVGVGFIIGQILPHIL